jgi:hypothetical protein
MIIILRKFVEIEILSNAALDTIREALTAPKKSIKAAFEHF